MVVLFCNCFFYSKSSTCNGVNRVDFDGVHLNRVEMPLVERFITGVTTDNIV